MVRQRRRPTTPAACSSSATAAVSGSTVVALVSLTKRQVQTSTIVKTAGQSSMRCTSTQEGKSHFSPLIHFGEPTWETPNGGSNYSHEHATTSKACCPSAWLELYACGAGITGHFRATTSLTRVPSLAHSATSSMLARSIHEQLLNKHPTDNNIPSTSL
jgi:hypothetical protein